MNIIFIICTLVIGLAIGSFLNVVLFRIHTGRGVGGRSSCQSCNKTLTAIDLVPVFSWLFLRGRCRQCKSKISWQYPLVEILTSGLFLLVYFKYQALFGIIFLGTNVDSTVLLGAVLKPLIGFIVMSLSVLILTYDIKHKIIPDIFSFILGVVAFLQIFITTNGLNYVLNFPGWWAVFAGPIVALPFLLIWLVSSGRWMGFGDFKLAFGIGWLLGIYYGFSAIILAFWIGAVVSLAILSVSKKMSIKSQVPFAPFLIAGMLLVYFYQIDAYHLFSNFF